MTHSQETRALQEQAMQEMIVSFCANAETAKLFIGDETAAAEAFASALSVALHRIWSESAIEKFIQLLRATPEIKRKSMGMMQ